MASKFKIDLAKTRERLLQLRGEILSTESTGKEAAQIVELDQSRVGRLSRIDALQGQAISINREQRRQIELQRIAAALGRLDNDEYGYCVSCGENIALRRLDVDPATPLCIECANKSDV